MVVGLWMKCGELPSVDFEVINWMNVWRNSTCCVIR